MGGSGKVGCECSTEVGAQAWRQPLWVPSLVLPLWCDWASFSASQICFLIGKMGLLEHISQGAQEASWVPVNILADGKHLAHYLMCSVCLEATAETDTLCTRDCLLPFPHHRPSWSWGLYYQGFLFLISSQVWKCQLSISGKLQCSLVSLWKLIFNKTSLSSLYFIYSQCSPCACCAGHPTLLFFIPHLPILVI